MSIDDLLLLLQPPLLLLLLLLMLVVVDEVELVAFFTVTALLLEVAEDLVELDSVAFKLIS